MSDTELKISITADAKGVEPGIEQAKGSLAGLASFIEGNKAKFTALAGEIGHWSQQAIHAVKSVTDASVKYTSDVERLSGAFGISLSRADAFHAALTKLGIETGTATGLASKMVQQLRQNEEGFHRLGVATLDNQGHFRNLQDIFLDGLDRLRDYKEGVDRTGAAQTLFGHDVGDLTEILQLNRKELEEGARTARELGLQTTGEGVVAMHQYRQAVAEVSEVWEAFKIQIGRALLPYLIELGQWFRQHGPAAIQATISAIKNIITGFQLLLEIPSMLKHDFIAAFDVLGALTMDLERRWDATVAKLEVAGQAMNLALTGFLPEAVQAWRGGMAGIERQSDAAAKQVKAQWRDAAAQVEAVNREIDQITRARDLDPLDHGQTKDPFSAAGFADMLRRAGLTTGDPHPGGTEHLGSSGGAPRQEAPQQPKSRMDKWEAALADQQRAYAVEMQRQDSFQEWSAASTASYWAKILGLHNLSNEERKGATDRWLSADKEARKQEFDARTEDLQEQITRARYDADQQVELAKQVAAQIKAKYTERSEEYRRAMAQVEELSRRASDQHIRDVKRESEEDRNAALARVDLDEQSGQFLVQMGLRTEGQLLAQERSFEEQRYQAQVRQMRRVQDAMKGDPNTDPEALKQLEEQIEALDRQHQQKMAQNAQKLALERTKIERQAIQELSSSWGQAMGRLLTLQQGFAATVRSLFQGLQQAIGNALGSIIQNWLSQHLSALLLGKAASKAAAVSDITTSAARAGAAGLASYAGAPWPIDTFAPAFGQLMFQNAMGYIGFASAAGGWWEVPDDTMAAIHKNEMVLPAWAAAPLRSMLSGGANTNAPFAANDGRGSNAAAFHYHDHSGRLTPDQIRANKGAFVKMLREAHRDFALAPGVGGRR